MCASTFLIKMRFGSAKFDSKYGVKAKAFSTFLYISKVLVNILVKVLVKEFVNVLAIVLIYVLDDR